MSTSPRRATFFFLLRLTLFSTLLGALAVVSGCSGPTEVVLHFTVMGAPPPSVTARLARSVPFSGNPPVVPSFVMTALDGPFLALMIQLSGPTTSVSLLPAGGGTPMDLKVLVDAGSYRVMPAGSQDISFIAGTSRSVTFTITAPVNDGGVDAAPGSDGGKPHDLAIVDAKAGG